MPKEARKLLENQSVGVAVQVTSFRLKRAGVTVSTKMGLKRKAAADQKVSSALGRRLAGIDS